MLTILETTLAVGFLCSKDQQVRNHKGCGDNCVLGCDAICSLVVISYSQSPLCKL